MFHRHKQPNPLGAFVGNYLINGVRFDGQQKHYMSCSVYRNAKDNKPHLSRCDCTYKQDYPDA